MIQQQAHLINSFLMVMDALCVIAAGYGAYFIRSALPFEYFGYYWSMDTNVFVGSVLVIMFANNYLPGNFGLYSDSRPVSYFGLLWTIAKAVMIDIVVLSTGIFVLKLVYSRLFLSLFAVQCFIYLAFMRCLMQFYFDRFAKNKFNSRKILIVGDKGRADLIADILKKQMSWGHEVVGRLSPNQGAAKTADLLGNIDDLPACLQQYPIDEVVFALKGDRSMALLEKIDFCRKIGVQARILPSLWQDTDQALSVETIQDVPFLLIETERFNAVGLLYKRVLDLLVGLVGLAFLCSIYPFLAIIIKLDSEGPVLFKQKRIGRRGRVFNLYKFRSMSADAEDRKSDLMEKNIMQGAVFKLENDPRITRVGRWLRKTSLDELPQLINVIKGEMSLVGIRPPILEEVPLYRVRQLRRISAKPGITGLWQISGRNKITDFNEIVKLDFKYIDHWTFSTDIKILFKTLIVLLQRKGAM